MLSCIGTNVRVYYLMLTFTELGNLPEHYVSHIYSFFIEFVSLNLLKDFKQFTTL